tara:strand:+ start:2816 stop:3847 length:1032 start_codon:yes stop_codon:yes gene_type:complete
MINNSTNKTIIIAEAGVNHNGDINLAFDLVDKAADSGADIIKFQTFQTKNLIVPKAKKAQYQIKTTSQKESQSEMLSKLELDKNDHYKLINKCDSRGIEFLSTAFDLESLDFLESLDLSRFKIPSGEITNLPYLKQIGSFGKPVILSTGMANLAEIESAIEVLELSGTDRGQITILHCTTEYPAPMNEVNLKAMSSISTAFGLSVGYSDHTKGIEVAISAVALGAKVIEKHLTLDRTLPGPDHLSSLEPIEFKEMVDAIRNIEVALGDGIKRPTESEKINKLVARKSIVAAKNINKGDLLTKENITTKRPGYGISPMEWENVIGKYALKDFKANELIVFYNDY